MKDNSAQVSPFLLQSSGEPLSSIGMKTIQSSVAKLLAFPSV